MEQRDKSNTISDLQGDIQMVAHFIAHFFNTFKENMAVLTLQDISKQSHCNIVRKLTAEDEFEPIQGSNSQA